ncbi:hypothetical protein RCJ22_15880 [Vibrio sp. FNV 38]|nr:hypothetical protein [Vibrio sp. FNV 38]
MKNQQTIRKYKKTLKRACQASGNLYNASSLTRETPQGSKRSQLVQKLQANRLKKDLKKVVDTMI